MKAAFADVLGAPRREQVAVLPSVSYGMAIVARNVPFRPGQHIVVAGEQFPSNVHPWRRLAEQRGGEVRAVAPPEQRDGRAAAWNDALHDAIDERTAMLAIGHVHWADGTRFDLPRLAARAREVGAWVVIDGTQSVGALDFPFDQVRPDAVMCAAYKWLMGPYGIALGWFGDVLQDGEPIEETWAGRRGSEDFRGLADYTDCLRAWQRPLRRRATVQFHHPADGDRGVAAGEGVGDGTHPGALCVVVGASAGGSR